MILFCIRPRKSSRLQILQLGVPCMTTDYFTIILYAISIPLIKSVNHVLFFIHKNYDFRGALLSYLTEKPSCKVFAFSCPTCLYVAMHDTQNAPCQPAFRHSHWIPITNIAFYVYCNMQQSVYFYSLLFLTQTEDRLYHGTSLSKTQETKQHSKLTRAREELAHLPHQHSIHHATCHTAPLLLEALHSTPTKPLEKNILVLMLFPSPLGKEQRG